MIDGPKRQQRQEMISVLEEEWHIEEEACEC